MRFLIALIFVLTLPSYTPAQTGLRIKLVSHSNMSGAPHGLGATDSAATIYVQGLRLRNESEWSVLGPMVTIQRCDTQVVYTLLPQKREYLESHMPSPDEVEKAKKEAQQKRGDGPPNLIIETTTADTGEAKEAFGYTAHHYITTTNEKPSPELSEGPSQIVEDAWYLDMPDVLTCGPASHRPSGLISTRIGGLTGDPRTLQQVRPEFRYSGPEPQGLVLSSKRTTRSVRVLQTGERQNTEFTSSHEIVEMSEVPIDPALFEVPPGFTKVTQLTGK